jgi:LacI family transcriptional regulator
VARAAGVSISTVSRVVRNHADVRESTRSHVLQIIEDLGYRPSSIARALVSGRSFALGLLVNDIANPFYPQLAKAIEREAKRQGYAVVVCNTDDDPHETVRYLQMLLDEGIQGVIHASVAGEEEACLALLSDTNRIIFTNRRPRSPQVNYVVSDNVAGGAALADHLLSRGHRRIGFINGPQFAATSRERVEGFLQQMSRVKGAKPILARGDFVLESGAKAVAMWIQEGVLPTAIIGVNDLVALGAFEGVLAAGLRVPEDVAIAGFDDIAMASSTLVSLTSVAQHIDQMGTRAVQVLLRATSKPPRRPIHEVLPPEVVVRRSTSAAPARRAPANERRRR